MLLSFGEMLSALYVDLKYGDAPTADVTVRLKRLLNEGHRALCRTRRLSEERALELEFSSMGGQMYHGIPQAFDGIRDIIQIDSAVPLKMRTREWFVANDPQQTATGTPYVWSPNGMQPVRRQPPIDGSGLWAVSTSPADTTQQVRVLAVRARSGFTTEQVATLNGINPVRVGALGDIAAVAQFTLSAPCVGDVSLIDGPGLPFTVPPGQPLPETPFPQGALLDDFNRADENPLSGVGQWQGATWWANAPLALVNNTVGQSSLTNLWAASYLTTRFASADAEAYVTVTTLPGPEATGAESYVAIVMSPERPIITAGTNLGYWLGLVKTYGTTQYRIVIAQVPERPAPPQELAVVNVPFAPGDAFGFERRGGVVRAHVRNAGVWHQVAEVPGSAHAVPLYPALLISDDSFLTKLDNFGGGPYSAHLLGTIDRFAGTSQPYYSIRLWPTPEGELSYTVRGTLRIPDMVRDQDYPVFMQPEFTDACMTYCRMREYKTVKADSERFEMELAEWEGVLAGLNAAANFPKDYRPVAGRGDRSGWSNLGGWYPADGMSWM